MYGCEIWGPTIISKNLKSLKSMNNIPLEIVQNNFCKHVLGVRRSASNIAAKAELGKFPILQDIIGHATAYWQRFSKMSDQRLAKLVYQNEIKEDEHVKNWSNKMKEISHHLGQNLSAIPTKTEMKNAFANHYRELFLKEIERERFPSIWGHNFLT